MGACRRRWPAAGDSPAPGKAVVAGALLGQSVGLADRRLKVDGEWCVAGSGPSRPGPGQQFAAHPVQLTDVAPPEAAQEGAQGGSFTVPPRVRAVPPVRNTSASSMPSPPASADATRVIILSPLFARPGALPRSRRCWTSWGRPRRRAKVEGRSSPALLTRRWSSKGKCSDLRGSEQPAAFQEGIETSSPPGAKEGCQGHLAVGALP